MRVRFPRFREGSISQGSEFSDSRRESAPRQGTKARRGDTCRDANALLRRQVLEAVVGVGRVSPGVLLLR